MSNNYLPDDYVPVHERVNKFREEDGGKISTEMIARGDNFIGFKAKVELDNEHAMGHGFETKQASQDTVGDKWREKAETVAVGRALAFLGYEAESGIASREEVKSAQNSKPKNKQKPPPEQNDDTPPADIDAIKKDIEAKKDEWQSWDDPATKKQAQAFASFWNDNIETGDEDRIEFLEMVTERELESSKDLYKSEISPILEQAYNNTDKFVKLCKNFNEEIPF